MRNSKHEGSWNLSLSHPGQRPQEFCGVASRELENLCITSPCSFSRAPRVLQQHRRNLRTVVGTSVGFDKLNVKSCPEKNCCAKYWRSAQKRSHSCAECEGLSCGKCFFSSGNCQCPCKSKSWLCLWEVELEGHQGPGCAFAKCGLFLEKGYPKGG